MKKPRIVSLIVLLALAFLSGAEALAITYTTNFPLTEDPISESGNWINGKTIGIDWNNIRTTTHLAYGTGGGTYADPTAILTGTWYPDQSATATVHSINQNGNSFQEVELRLRSAISANSNTGYEINFRCLKTGGAYSEIVRWNGPLGNFTYLSRKTGSQYGVTEGDVVKATIIGNVINVYLNGVLINTATDNTYITGNPGIGFYGPQSTDFGFTSFTATELRPGTTYTVTPSAAAGGSITPSSPVMVNAGTTTSFTISTQLGYHLMTPIGGTCGGSLAGSTYTTNPVYSNCSVAVSFGHSVTASAGANGSLSCVSPVMHGSTTTCTASPNGGYNISSISGCGGTWVSGKSYTTGPITGDCTVSAIFAATITDTTTTTRPSPPTNLRIVP